ncbi:uncharacterized protein LOC123322722 [Coccinella septempunctata]|uniref:uncharacterized protein LOC123322722 n=1 Tax=Coccinella septempunctata TaxID=41139 RepID=UPI001D07EC38|nr:uncharacterized protein LOC123322722 [Coccinella septempunctata]
MDLKNLCMAGGLPLAKWQSNSPSTLKMVTEEEMIPSPISFDDCPTSTKRLGLLWYPQEDYFSFKINSSSSGSVELWLQKLSWDEPLSPQLTERWCNIREDLKSLANVRAPRWIHRYTQRLCGRTQQSLSRGSHLTQLAGRTLFETG